MTLTPAQEYALEIARQIAAAGVPVWCAYPDPEGKTLSGKATGYALPTGWEKNAANPSYVNAWRPGMALCATMGHGLDLADGDPRHGGDLAAIDGMTPRIRGRQATPSGGEHWLVSSMGVRSRDAVLPGIDVKAGDENGQGVGFAFIAPTIRKSKVTGELIAYRWIEPPDLEGLREDAAEAARSKLAAMVRQAHSKTSSAGFQQPGGHSDGWTDPDIAQLIGGGVPAGEVQQPVLRDTVARLVGQGYDRVVCRGIWQAIVDRTKLTDPAWPWAEADFDDMYDSAARKYAATQRGGRHRADEWDLPAPLGMRRVLPAFPVDIFPGWLRQQVTALTEFAQVPVDLPAVISLSVLAAAAGGRAVVEIRGSWREPLNLYTVTALPPGSRKSAAFAELTQPLLDTEQALTEKIGPQIIEATTARKVAQRDADKLAAQASGLDNDEARAQALANAIDAAQLAEAITVPVMPKLVADDVTPEAAASLLAEQGGRLAVLSAEGGCFATLSGRYSGTPNLEVFLKGHSGDMLRVDRKGRPPEHIPHPALTLGLAVQPQVLRDIAEMPGFRGRGLLARILYSIPPNTVGSRKIRTDPIPEDVRDTYAASIRALVLTLAEWDDPAVLMLTPEAAELILTTAENLEPRLGPEGDLGHIADWASKLIGATARIAGLLHLAANLEDGWGKPVSAETMAAAVRTADYFVAHALAAFDGMGADPVLEDARHVLAWLARCSDKKFTKRDLFRAEQSRFKKIAELDPVLAVLEQHGYIRQAEQPDRQGPGRKPSPEYAIHPDLDETTLRC